jgi:hypothetical protein
MWMSERVRLRQHTDGSIAVSRGGRWCLMGESMNPWVDELEVTGPGWSELLVAELPEPDGWAATRTPYWETGRDTYTAWTDGVEDADGLNEGTDLEWLRAEALKMLAAVAACERYRAEREAT